MVEPVELGTRSNPIDAYTDRLNLNLRTSDPSNPGPGEAWVRTDLDSGDKLGTLRVQGVGDVPIFPTGMSGENVIEVFRCQLPAGTGFVPLASTGGTYSQLGFQHDGSAYRFHDALSAQSAIPDSGMFQSPLYQYTAVAGLSASGGATADNWTEQLAGAGDATAVGAPTYRADQAGYEAVEYDGTDDGSDVPSDGQLPTGTGPVSIAVTLFVKSSHTGNVTGYGNGADTEWAGINLGSDGSVVLSTWGGTIPSATATGTYSTGQWITVGVKASSSEIAVLLNGGNKGTSTTNTSQLSLADANRSIGYRAVDNNLYSDIFVYDLVISDAYEADQAFADYHNDRIPP